MIKMLRFFCFPKNIKLKFFHVQEFFCSVVLKYSKLSEISNYVTYFDSRIGGRGQVLDFNDLKEVKGIVREMEPQEAKPFG